MRKDKQGLDWYVTANWEEEKVNINAYASKCEKGSFPLWGYLVRGGSEEMRK